MGTPILTRAPAERTSGALPAHTSNALASWRGASTVVAQGGEELPLPTREDADAFAPRLRWERDLVELLLEPAMRHCAAQASGAGRDAAPDLPSAERIWPPSLQGLRDVYAGWLNAQTIARAALAYAWHYRLSARERAALIRALRLDPSVPTA